LQRLISVSSLKLYSAMWRQLAELITLHLMFTVGYVFRDPMVIE